MVQKQTIIPAGFRVTVKSWENDGDNYNTKSKAGLNASQVRLFVDLFKILKSRNSSTDTKFFGNMYEPSDKEIKAFTAAVTAILVKHNALGEGEGQYVDTDHFHEDVVYEFGLSGEFYTRVVEKFTVEFIPADIFIDDVTDQFKN